MHQPLAPAHSHRKAVLADLLELAGAQTHRQVRPRPPHPQLDPAVTPVSRVISVQSRDAGRSGATPAGSVRSTHEPRHQAAKSPSTVLQAVTLRQQRSIPIEPLQAKEPSA